METELNCHNMKISSTSEAQRMDESKNKIKPWMEWGPYLSERQWGTVREDYSPDGSAWDYFSHAQARSRTYRWGEDGIAGISDINQNLCFALSFWNEKDPFIKERLFGLTGPEGNHGEDVKEYYFYLSNTPSHSYMKYLYKYPQQEYPYAKLITENKKKKALPNLGGMEYELMDTGVFDQDKYFDIFVEYAKKDAEDILIKINIVNRGKEAAKLWVLPTLWFRNVWSWTDEKVEKPNLELKAGSSNKQRPLKPSKPSLQQKESLSVQHTLEATWQKNNKMWFYCQNASTVLFTENETNTQRIYNKPNATPYVKDSMNEYLINKNDKAVKEKTGTKAVAFYWLEVEAGHTETICLRLSKTEISSPFGTSFYELFKNREIEMNEFYNCLCHDSVNSDLKEIQRQAFAGMLWNKQFYYYDVKKWLTEGKQGTELLKDRLKGRNKDWKHFSSSDIISMPDKWEYPWFAAWDLAFHAIPFSIIDPEFAKHQLRLLTRETYLHPNGQLPAYEFNFSDVNPPVLAYAALKVYNIEKKIYGKPDRKFLKLMFNKLLLNFTWWVNKKDATGNNLFEGGFLGFDNISIIDRSHHEVEGLTIEQSDGTAWMGMFCLNMLRISIELSKKDDSYQEWASKFLQHYLMIAEAMNSIGSNGNGLWDDEDKFYYDKFRLQGKEHPVQVRSLVGLIPLYAIEIIDLDKLNKDLRNQLVCFLENKKLENKESTLKNPNVFLCTIHGRHGHNPLDPVKIVVLSFVDEERLRHILKRVFDENEFLSPYGIRSLSKVYENNPYSISDFSIDYQPAESKNDMFGGNSNWRGPIWFPVNILLIESIMKFYQWLGDDFKIEYPTKSGNLKTLKEIAIDLSKRLTKIFEKDNNNQRPVFGDGDKFQNDPNWNNYILFYEFFHGDNGAGIGASHQTGWTGLVAKLIQNYWNY